MTYEGRQNAITSVCDYPAGVNGYIHFKRAFDFVVSLLLIILLALPMLVIAVGIKLDSKGKVIFRQKRVGKGGKEFEIFKFRTMFGNAPSNMAKRDFEDPYKYITKFGGFLRKTSMDELPQLFNILRGDMSFIGPRPLVVNETDIHELRTQYGVYEQRPGITGWAQINGRDNVSPQEKASFDAYYAKNISPLLDLRIFLRTFLVVLKCDGYSEGSSK